MSVAILIINYQSKKYTEDLLVSMANMHGEFDVYILDNGSRRDEFDLTAEYIKSKYKLNSYIFKSSVNLGFAGGNNYLIEKVKKEYEYIWFLYNDTLVYEDSLSELMNVMAKDLDIGVCSPVILYPDKSTVWWAGSEVRGNSGYITKLHQGLRLSELLLSNKKDYYLSDEIVGTSMLVRKDVLDKVGAFDSDTFYFMWEDTDLSKRIIEAGHKCAVITKSKIIHRVGKSSGGNYSAMNMYYVERGRIFFVIKYSGNVLGLIPLWCKRIIAPILKVGKLDSSYYALLGIIDGLRKFYGEKNF